MSVYTAIKNIAKKKRLSIYKIERDLDYSNGLISKWDKSMPGADTLQTVADYLGVTSSFILNKSRQKEGK
ncbi:XRE family transcriptional regulator [Pediococcus parvulus]|uniref:XRE family transcriptional regulator n=1 Tax=Pediococcus parvulus TaxID=54062 RepID=UPI00345EEC6B